LKFKETELELKIKFNWKK